MKNWHNTLNQAIEAAGLCVSVWPLGFNLDYNQTARIVSNGLFVSVCRFENGNYETAISYESGCENFAHVIDGV